MPTLLDVIVEAINSVINSLQGIVGPGVSIFGRIFYGLAALVDLITLGLFAAG